MLESGKIWLRDAYQKAWLELIAVINNMKCRDNNRIEHEQKSCNYGVCGCCFLFFLSSFLSFLSSFSYHIGLGAIFVHRGRKKCMCRSEIGLLRSLPVILCIRLQFHPTLPSDLHFGFYTFSLCLFSAAAWFSLFPKTSSVSILLSFNNTGGSICFHFTPSHIFYWARK